MLTPKSIARLRSLSRRVETALVEFGPLGSDVKWRKPIFEEHPGIPMGAAAFVPPSGARLGKWTDTTARRAGAVLTSPEKAPEWWSKAMGYPDSASVAGALKRHEIVHSIQTAKRGYKTPHTIGEIFKDEVDAYASMNRNVRGGSKFLRGANAAAGVAQSTVQGALNNPRTRPQATAALVGGAAGLAGGLLLVRNHRNKDREDR